MNTPTNTYMNTPVLFLTQQTGRYGIQNPNESCVNFLTRPTQLARTIESELGDDVRLDRDGGQGRPNMLHHLRVRPPAAAVSMSLLPMKFLR